MNRFRVKYEKFPKMNEYKSAVQVYGIPGLLEELINNLDSALPIIFYYNHHDSLIQNKITSRIKRFYFDNNVTAEKIKNVTNLFGDGWFLSAMDLYLRMRLSHKEAAPSYAYLLTEQASASYSKIFHGDPEKLHGVAHTDDAIFLFPVRDRFFSSTLPTEGENQVREAMIQMWVDFARTGNPTPDSRSLPKWNEINRFPVDYYQIGNTNFEEKSKFEMERGGLFEERAQFWRTIGVHFPEDYPNKDEL